MNNCHTSCCNLFYNCFSLFLLRVLCIFPSCIIFSMRNCMVSTIHVKKLIGFNTILCLTGRTVQINSLSLLILYFGGDTKNNYSLKVRGFQTMIVIVTNANDQIKPGWWEKDFDRCGKYRVVIRRSKKASTVRGFLTWNLNDEEEVMQTYGWRMF